MSLWQKSVARKMAKARPRGFNGRFLPSIKANQFNADIKHHIERKLNVLLVNMQFVKNQLEVIKNELGTHWH